MRIGWSQKASGGPEQSTLYDDLGVYKVLASANDTSSTERSVGEWLAPLIDAWRMGIGLGLVIDDLTDRPGPKD
jgi:hypothetical protein